MPIGGPDLGPNNYRGQEPLYEPLGVLQAFQQSHGYAASPTQSILGGGPLLGQTPHMAGGFNPNQQRYQTGYQMPRRPQNQGLKAFVRQRMGLM
jgi:hypothetical protein